MKKINLKLFIPAILLIALTALTAQTNFAQSTDPDSPTVMTSGTISGTNTSNINEENTYYYTFDVNKGMLTLTLDLTPANKSDAGGFLQWTLLTTKFEKLKYDNLPAHASPERQVKDMTVTIKRRTILKIVVSGKTGYKIKLSGSAVNFGNTK